MFVPEADGVVVATMLTQGPWDPNSQYGGTPAALLTWAVEGVPTLVPMRIARITSTCTAGSRWVGSWSTPTSCAKASACRSWWRRSAIRTGRRWRARRRCGSGSVHGPDAPTDPSVPPIATPPLGAPRAPGPRSGDLNGFIDATEMRDAGTPGAATTWYRATKPVIAGEAPSPTVRLAWASDFTANSGNYLDCARWSAINADLTINLSRAPQGEWTGVATRAWYSLDGIGHARADLFDRDGFVGTCTASLLVDEIAAPY